MKTIEYEGKQYYYPNWANYVAGDLDGQVWAFYAYPDWDENVGQWDSNYWQEELIEVTKQVCTELKVMR